MNFNNVHVVLVGTLYSRNLGSCSRTMANMGAGRLITVRSACEYNLEARQGASGAQKRLVERTEYATWKDFFANEKDGIRVAFCGIKKPETDYALFQTRAQELSHSLKNDNETPLYLIFGPEDHGLENEDVEFAHHICKLPTYEYMSLNLSHAVLLTLHMLRAASENAVSVPAAPISSATPDAEKNDKFYFPEKSIRDWLITLGFELDDRRKGAYQTLKRILLNQRATPKELRILEAIIFQTTRKLNERKVDAEKN